MRRARFLPPPWRGGSSAAWRAGMVVGGLILALSPARAMAAEPGDHLGSKAREAMQEAGIDPHQPGYQHFAPYHLWSEAIPPGVDFLQREQLSMQASQRLLQRLTRQRLAAFPAEWDDLLPAVAIYLSDRIATPATVITSGDWVSVIINEQQLSIASSHQELIGQLQQGPWHTQPAVSETILRLINSPLPWLETAAQLVAHGAAGDPERTPLVAAVQGLAAGDQAGLLAYAKAISEASNRLPAESAMLTMILQGIQQQQLSPPWLAFAYHGGLMIPAEPPAAGPDQLALPSTEAGLQSWLRSAAEALRNEQPAVAILALRYVLSRQPAGHSRDLALQLLAYTGHHYDRPALQEMAEAATQPANDGAIE